MSLPTTVLTASTTSVSSSSVKKAISSLVNHLEVPQERAGFPDEIQYLRPANLSVIELNSVLLSLVVFALVRSISNVLPLTTAELNRVNPASASDVSHNTSFTIIFLLGMNSLPTPVSCGTSMWLIVCGQTAAFSCCFEWSIIGNETAVTRRNRVSINLPYIALEKTPKCSSTHLELGKQRVCGLELVSKICAEGAIA
jgi:hypothetical protein